MRDHDSISKESDDSALAAALAENARLRDALDRQHEVSEAIGVLMWRYRIDGDAAFALLRRWSQDSNIKLHTIAVNLLEVAAQRARRARPGDSVGSDPIRTDDGPDAELRNWLELQLTG